LNSWGGRAADGQFANKRNKEKIPGVVWEKDAQKGKQGQHNPKEEKHVPLDGKEEDK